MTSKRVYWTKGCSDSQRLSGKPSDVPLARTLNISNLNIKGTEIEGSYSVECYVENNQGPLEKGVGSVGWLAWFVSGLYEHGRLIG